MCSTLASVEVGSQASVGGAADAAGAPIAPMLYHIALPSAHMAIPLVRLEELAELADARGCCDSEGGMYSIVELDEVENGVALRAELADIKGRTSMPAVFAGGKFLGGCNDGGEGGIATLKANGRLEELLAQAGAWTPTQRI